MVFVLVAPAAARSTSPTGRCARTRYLQAGVGALVGRRRRRVHARRHDGADAESRSRTAFPEAACEFGGGHNVVNVTLVDIRAWDTMGEIAVLVVAATGVASLIFIQRRGAASAGSATSPIRRGVEKRPRTPDDGPGCPGRGRCRPERRSIILEVVTRLVFHTVVVFSRLPALRRAQQPRRRVRGRPRHRPGPAGALPGRRPLRARRGGAGRPPGRWSAPGCSSPRRSGLVPLAFGGAVLQSAIVETPRVPLLGDVKLVTSTVLRHRRLPRRRRPHARPAAQPRLGHRPAAAPASSASSGRPPSRRRPVSANLALVLTAVRPDRRRGHSCCSSGA